MTGGRGREREVKCDELPAATRQVAEESEQERAAPPSPLRRGEGEGKNNPRKEEFFIDVSILRLKNSNVMISRFRNDEES